MKPDRTRVLPFWVLKAIKIGVGSSVAVLICELMGMQYATFAGIVTLLTIRNTKRGTLAIAGKRFLSFAASMMCLALLWNTIENTNFLFVMFMLILAGASCAAKWEDTISVNAVVGGHVLLLERTMTQDFIWNELGLLTVGLGVAIVFNSYIPGNLAEIQEDIAYVEAELSAILHTIAQQLHNAEGLNAEAVRLCSLKEHIAQAGEKALDNMNNTLTVAASAQSKYYVEYLNMRKGQCALLLQVHQALLQVTMDCEEVQQIAEIVQEIAQAVHYKVGIRAIIAELEEVVCHMKTETLPQTNMEFACAVQVFYVLELLEEFLREKRAFLLTLTEREKELYWKE